MKYRIVENKYFDAYGDEHLIGYNVQIRKSFLGIEYWRSCTKEICDTSGCYNEAIVFSKLKNAEDFIKEKLCTDTPRDEHKSKVIGEYGC